MTQSNDIATSHAADSTQAYRVALPKATANHEPYCSGGENALNNGQIKIAMFCSTFQVSKRF